MLTLTGMVQGANIASASAQTVNLYRPLNTGLVQYDAVDVPNHFLFANYNGPQFDLTRQTGRVLFSLSYTFGKALRIKRADKSGSSANYLSVYDSTVR